MRTHSEADRECEPVAAKQHGIVTRLQALAAGHTTRSIGLRLASGYFAEVHPSVYRIGGSTKTWESGLAAAFLWACPNGFVSHRSAAALHGLDGVGRDMFEVSLPEARRTPGVIVHRIAPDDRPRLRASGMFQLTWVERTLLDLCSVLAAPKTGLALDDALRKRKTTLQRLWDELEEAGGRGRRGSRTFRELLRLRDDRDGRLASNLEADTLRVLRHKSLPMATPQFVVAEAGDHAPRLDFAYPAYRVGVESHSYRYHMDPNAWKHDWARDRKLKLLGWVVLHYTYDDVHFERDRVVEEIRTLLVSRGALLV
jgi:hypothetical protein